MKRDDRMLWVAAGLGVGSLLLWTASLTIAIITVANPPAPPYLTPALSQSFATAANAALIAAVVTIPLPLWNLAQVIARRPIGIKEATARRWPVSSLRVAIFAAVTLVLTAFSAKIYFNIVTLVLMKREQPLTNNVSFGMLGTVLSSPGLVWTMLSYLIFLRWWQGATASSEEPGTATATSAAA